MPTSYKPDGYTSVAPYLIVPDAAITIAFLQQLLGAVEIRRFESSSGRIQHAEMRIDDTVVMLADEIEGFPAIAANVHVYVPDVDATYAKALLLGAVSIQEPTKKDDPDRRAGFTEGGSPIKWWVATKVD